MLDACGLKCNSTCCDCSGMEESEAAEVRRGLAIVYDGYEMRTQKKLGIFAELLHDCYQRSLELI